jgi:4-hydroxythreonine-4-phosphate dehydrogenase
MQSRSQPGLPVMLITAGDPAGIGPEIVLKTLIDAERSSLCQPVVVGDVWVMEEVSRRLGRKAVIHACEDISDCTSEAGMINVMGVGTEGIQDMVPGRVQTVAARSATASIRKAVELALRGETQAIVTGPINKEALRLGGYPWIGHTEMLQDLTQSNQVRTMFVTGPLRVFFATRHMSLKQAIESLKKSLIYEAIVDTDSHMKELGFSQPRLAVAGLNPHAGDGGLFGREEIDEIEPAVRQARNEGICVEGPVPADSVFYRCIMGAFDAVIALTHDQGHIATKTYDFHRTVSVTLGLPFIRTSVDHGTAFDIAWQGKADPTSLKEALAVAVQLQQGFGDTETMS